MRVRRLQRVLGLGLATVLGLPLTAAAADSAYCRRVRAEAASEAARLVSPRFVAQGLRFPQNLTGLPFSGAEGSGTSPFQVRAGLAWDPIELVKGVELVRAAEDDCAEQAARTELEVYLENAEGSARLPALRRQAEYLARQQDTWQLLLATQEQAFGQHVITLFELNQVRARTLDLQRRLVQARGESERLAARGYQRPEGHVNAVVERWLTRALRLDTERTAVRGLSYWNMRLTGGVVGANQAPDWYAMAEFSVHLGLVAQDVFDRRALEARAVELRTERSGAEVRVTGLQQHLSLLAVQARRELDLVQQQLDGLAATRKALDRADTANASWASALMACDELIAESERVYLSAWADELGALLKENAP